MINMIVHYQYHHHDSDHHIHLKVPLRQDWHLQAKVEEVLTN